jgi:transposase
MRLYSGIGGQMDFARGASLSPGGKASFALPSTAHGAVPAIPDRYRHQGTSLDPVRWRIEQTFGLLNRFRRLAVRYERTATMHLALLTLGCCLICVRHLRGRF